ncbi:V-type ATP synthase subunit E [[Eubacterium] cellulosolvens]
MTIEKIIQKIESETKTEVDKILAEAQQTVKALKAESTKELSENLNQIKAQGDKRVKIMRNIHLSEARRITRKNIQSAKEELIQLCFDQAKDRLRNLKGEEYKKVLARLVRQSMELVGQAAVATVTREEDKVNLRAFPHITVKPELAPGLGGLIMASADGKVVVDNTFDAILDRQLEEIRTEVAKILFPEEK